MSTLTGSKLLITIALLAGLSGGSAWADVAWITAKVTRTLVQPDGTYGGCMAALSVSPASVLPSCQDSWVSFSCTGDFGDVVGAWRQFDQSQLALAGDHGVLVAVDDSRKHNGYCYAFRIDVIK
jgi:hypothetical protein